jgi:hypothetical protein
MKPTLVAAAALLLMLDVPGTARADDRAFFAAGFGGEQAGPRDRS